LCERELLVVFVDTPRMSWSSAPNYFVIPNGKNKSSADVFSNDVVGGLNRYVEEFFRCNGQRVWIFL
jgi:hypothetical protein